MMILQIYWLLAVKYSYLDLSFFFWPISVFIVLINFIVYKPNISIRSYILITLAFSLWGWAQDAILVLSNTVNFGGNIFWLNSIWIIFIAYFGDVFNKFTTLQAWQLSLLGGVAGTFSYWSGCRIAGAEITNIVNFCLVIFTSWAVFFPLSIKIFHEKSTN